MQMTDSRAEIQTCILDILMTSEESFPIVHTDLIKNYGFDRDLDPSLIRRILQEMESDGLVRVWKPVPIPEGYWDKVVDEYHSWYRRRRRDDAYLTDLGPWFEITPFGEAEWTKAKDREPRLDPESGST